MIHRIPRTLIPLLILAPLAGCVVDELSGELADAIEFRAASLATDDPLPQEVLDDIDALLPWSQDATVNQPQLFPPDFDPNPEVVAANTEIWVTFAQESALYQNSLGYFTYPTGSPPSSLTTEALQDGLIFANASAIGSGGSLYNGARMSLGVFQPGVQIGFFLVQNGSCADPGVGSCSSLGVDFSKTVFTSVDAMNSAYATDPAKARHVVMADLLNDSASDARLLSFEDQGRLGSSDDDFNDVVFRVTASPQLGGDALPTAPATSPNDIIFFRGHNNGALLADCSYDGGAGDYDCAQRVTSCVGAHCSATGIWSPTHPMSGDVNGDGRMDVVQHHPTAYLSLPTCFSQADSSYVCQNLPTECTDCPYNPGHPSGIFGGDLSAMGDFDGNGQSDVAQFHSPTWLSIPLCRPDLANGKWTCGNYQAQCVGSNCGGSYNPGTVTSYAGYTGIFGATAVFGANTIASTGKDELVQYNPVWGSLPTCEFDGVSKIWTCANRPTTCDPSTSASCGNYGSGIFGLPLAAVGDFDGDGDDEVAQFGGSVLSIPVCFYDEASGSYVCDNTAASCMSGGDCSGSNGGQGIYASTEQVVVADVNNDGCDDIIMVNDAWESYPTCFSPCVSASQWLAGAEAWQCDNTPANCSGSCGNNGSGVWPNSTVLSGELH